MDFFVPNGLLMGRLAFFILDPLEQFNLLVIYCNKFLYLTYFSNITLILLIVLLTLLSFLIINAKLSFLH